MSRSSSQIDDHSDQPLLKAEQLRRVLGKERVVAVDDVALSVHAGRVHALLGPNGAGKTTIVRMCATLLKPSSGTLEVMSIYAVKHPLEARKHLGLVLGEDLGFYPRATARDNLLFFADIQGAPARNRKAWVKDALDRVGLGDVATRKVGAFSRGMRQRLHLARAILAKPAVLLLDEPTTGLDPDVALRVRDLINELVTSGTGILLTSHAMAEVEELADTISVIVAGSIVTRGGVKDIAHYAAVSQTTTFTLPDRASDTPEILGERLSGTARVTHRASAGQWAVVIYWSNTADLRSAQANMESILTSAGIERPVDLVTRPSTLEEAYLALVTGLAS